MIVYNNTILDSSSFWNVDISLSTSFFDKNAIKVVIFLDCPYNSNKCLLLHVQKSKSSPSLKSKLSFVSHSSRNSSHSQSPPHQFSALVTVDLHPSHEWALLPFPQSTSSSFFVGIASAPIKYGDNRVFELCDFH